MRRITHSCGHEQEHYIIGEYAADYDRQAAMLARRKCRICQTQTSEALAASSSATVAELAPASLDGSPKQIAWAETIRAKRLVALGNHDKHAVRAMAAVTDAKWWIDRRADPDHVLLAAAATIEVRIEVS